MSSVILLNGLDGVDASSIYLFIWYDNCLLKFLGFSSSIPVKKKYETSLLQFYSFNIQYELFLFPSVVVADL